MPQPIVEGSVLGGRYRINRHVVTSAEQDMVLQGRDQVLSRDVLILVAAADHASQVATSARELATGERQGEVQVLDLGISEGRTYLIASGDTAPEDLLELAQGQVYVEPFQTDTLGSEIFGQSRSRDPHEYEDDEDYYASLDVQDEGETSERSRPRFLDRISRQLNRRLGTAEDGADADGISSGAGAAAAGAAGLAAGRAADASGQDQPAPGYAGSAPQRSPRQDPPLPERLDDDDWTGDLETVGSRRTEPASPSRDTVPEAPQREVGRTDRGEDADVEHVQATSATEADEDSTTGAAAAAPGVAAVAAGSALGRGDQDHSEKVSLYEEDEDYATAPQGDFYDGDDDPEDEDEVVYTEVDDDLDAGEDDLDQDEEHSGASRWILGAILAVLLILAVVAASMMLGGNRQPGGDEPSPTGGETSPSATEPVSTLPAPQIAGVSRLVPDRQGLSEETDNTLENAIDGNPATAWQTYSFGNAEFGGYADSMALVVELEEPSAVSELTLTQTNGSGGTFEVLVGDSEDIESATQIAEGSFTGPEVTVPVSQEGAPAEGQYVIINFTELPRLANGTSTLPYGLRIAEVEVR